MADMSEGGALINVGELSKPATTLIEKISNAVGGLCKPWQIRRVADAEADAQKIQAAAKIEVTDLQRRAMMRFIQEEAAHQANMENITRLALPDVLNDAKPEQVQNDWITNFFDKCRLISDEEMQRIWARVLVGEANNPGNYSKRTVNLLSSLDKSDAELFRDVCSYGWFFGRPDGVVPLIYDVRADIYVAGGLTFTRLAHLDDVGLIRHESVAGFARKEIAAEGTVFYFGMPVHLVFPQPAGNKLPLGNVMLSKAGQELARICSPAARPGFMDYVVERWRKQGLKVTIQTGDAKRVS
ncbi:MAG TPA: DUF2806 domain-containing protein [Verrucomicrobiae bacterium]|nr:DUF2806 domain-containing protein [Verrucomicrobiae bacterium]